MVDCERGLEWAGCWLEYGEVVALDMDLDEQPEYL